MPEVLEHGMNHFHRSGCRQIEGGTPNLSILYKVSWLLHSQVIQIYNLFNYNIY